MFRATEGRGFVVLHGHTDSYLEKKATWYEWSAPWMRQATVFSRAAAERVALEYGGVVTEDLLSRPIEVD